MAEQNITSVLDKDQATNISLDNFIYLIQGYGADRDRWATLKQLFDANVLSRIEVKNVELTAGKSITISKDYNLVLVDNNQNSGAVLTVNTPSDQSYRGVLDVVVRWRDQQTERIGISIGNGTYYLQPQNSEWGRFFIGAEGRVWSYNVSVADYTVAEEYSGSGTHQSIPREWRVGKKGFSFKATNGGTNKEVELYFNGNWVLSGLGVIGSDVVFGGRIGGAKFNITTNLIEAIGDDNSLISASADDYVEGDVVLVYNKSPSSISVYCESIGPNYVDIKSGCTIPFRCVHAETNKWKWSPLADMEIKSVQ